jgi:hypothetical protein
MFSGLGSKQTQGVYDGVYAPPTASICAPGFGHLAASQIQALVGATPTATTFRAGLDRSARAGGGCTAASDWHNPGGVFGPPIAQQIQRPTSIASGRLIAVMRRRWDVGDDRRREAGTSSHSSVSFQRQRVNACATGKPFDRADPASTPKAPRHPPPDYAKALIHRRLTKAEPSAIWRLACPSTGSRIAVTVADFELAAERARRRQWQQRMGESRCFQTGAGGNGIR